MHLQVLALTLGGMLFGAALLFFTITGLLALLRKSVVARLPVIAEQIVAFEHPGTFILHVEHTRFATALLYAAFSLRDAAGTREVRSGPPILFRTTRSGFTTVRSSVRRFTVKRPGRYELSVTGIDLRNHPSEDALILTRPYVAPMVLLILGTVLGASCFIAGLVFSVLQIVGR
jgi:hypothetical protein